MQWTGLAKVGEEAAEVVQEVMKVIATDGDLIYGNGMELCEQHLWDELGDLIAAIRYFVEKNSVPVSYLEARATLKRLQYEEWFERERVR